MTPKRADGRAPADLRPVKITRGFTEYAPGSVLYECGKTRVLCTATVEEKVPDFLEGRGTGWVTAEYGMLPSSTPGRKRRAATRGRPDGREIEIQRILGRALRAVTDMRAPGGWDLNSCASASIEASACMSRRHPCSLPPPAGDGRAVGGRRNDENGVDEMTSSIPTE